MMFALSSFVIGTAIGWFLPPVIRRHAGAPRWASVLIAALIATLPAMAVSFVLILLGYGR